MRRRVSVAGIVGVTMMGGGCASVTPSSPSIDVKQLAASTSQFQKEILTDGVVTPAEYESALLAHRQCVTEAGADAGQLYEIGNNELTFDYEVVADSDEAVNEINTLADECMNLYRRDVGAVWAQQQLLTPQEREDLRPKVIRCLQAAGFDVAADADFDEIIAAIYQDGGIEASQECFQKYPGFFAVPAKPLTQ